MVEDNPLHVDTLFTAITMRHTGHSPTARQQQQQQQDEKEIEEEKEKIEQMLKALMQDEKEIREKMEEAEKAKVKAGAIEKNW